jgi:thiamine kinase-like enzyme
MSSSKRHFTVVMRNKEHGLYSSSSPSSAARKAVSKLCADNKNKKVEFYMRETTQLSNKKVYGPYLGYMQKLDKPIELKGRIIRYKPIAKLKKKSRKMKGGVEIIGEGQEGIVIRPNINNPGDRDTVSKLITATPEQKAELIAFEEKLNDKDKDGRFHVKMLGYRDITSNNINRIPNMNINQSIKNKMKKHNFKITYQYGGISIEQFLEEFKKYSELVNPRFIQALLRGIVNCFQGLYRFYDNGLVHSDLHAGNIVFLLDNPEIMRIIDWGSLLSEIPVFSEPNSALNHDPNTTLDKKMKGSLNGFYGSIGELLNKIKNIKRDNNKIYGILDKFLNIPFFIIYKSIRTARILTRDEIEAVRTDMEKIISEL